MWASAYIYYSYCLFDFMLIGFSFSFLSFLPFTSQQFLLVLYGFTLPLPITGLYINDTMKTAPTYLCLYSSVIESRDVDWHVSGMPLLTSQWRLATNLSLYIDYRIHARHTWRQLCSRPPLLTDMCWVFSLIFTFYVLDWNGSFLSIVLYHYFGF